MDRHNNSIGAILMEEDEEPESSSQMHSIYSGYSGYSSTSVSYLNQTTSQQTSNFTGDKHTKSPPIDHSQLTAPGLGVISSDSTAVFFAPESVQGNTENVGVEVGEETNEFGGQETINIQSSYPGTPITYSTPSSHQNSNFNSENLNRSSTDSPIGTSSSTSSSDSGDDDSTAVSFAPESIQAIAETVGVELDEEAAELIGQEAINKLRHLALLALQFSRHCKSKGLRVSEVSKAEKILDSTFSLGHGMNYNPPNFVNLGGICGEDEGPEIDLLSTINDASTDEITIDPNAEPTLSSHFVYYHDSLAKDSQGAYEHLDDYLSGSEQFQCKRRKTDFLNPQSVYNNDSTSVLNNRSNTSTEDRVNEKCENIESESTKIPGVNNEIDEEESGDNEADDSDSDSDDDENENDDGDSDDSDDEGEEGISEEETNDDVGEVVPVEWAEYLQNFLLAFFEKKKEIVETVELISLEENEYLEEEEILPKELNSFQIILKDVAQHGVFPVLPIICDFFHDFINSSFTATRNKQLKRITVFFDTTLVCPARCRIYYLKPMIDVLINMILLPVPCNVQAYVTKTLLKVADCSETPLNFDLLRWITQFIMGTLESSSKLTSSNLNEPIKTKICAAIYFAMGFDLRRLRLVKMHIWITQVLMISKIHCVMRQESSTTSRNNNHIVAEKYDFSDSYLEEAILNFIGMYIRKYQSSKPDDSLKSLLESAMDTYGEKLMMAICKRDLYTASYSSDNLCRRTSKWKAQNPQPIQPNGDKEITINEFLIRSGWLRHHNKFQKVSIPFVLNVI